MHEGLQLQQDVAFDLVGQGCFSTSAAQEPHHPHTPKECRAVPFPSSREDTHLGQWYLLGSFTITHSGVRKGIFLASPYKHIHIQKKTTLFTSSRPRADYSVRHIHADLKLLLNTKFKINFI